MDKHGLDQDQAARREIFTHLGAYLSLYAKGVGMLLFTPGSRDFCTLTGIASSESVNTGRYEYPAHSTIRAFSHMVLHSNAAKLTYIVMSGMILFLMYGLIIMGLGSLRLRNLEPSQLAHWFLLLLTLYYIVIVGALGTTRYRVPMMPLLLVLAGPGLLKMFGHRRER